MKIIRTTEDLQAYRKTLANSVGFVPTMGALHAGHCALIEAAKARHQHVVVSVFVNPMQFNEAKDLECYPRTEAEDQRLLETLGVSALFLPPVTALYPEGDHYAVDELLLSQDRCGAARPGHFRGVLTVVLKLLNLVQADAAYFGEKDYQQFELIQGMALALFLKTRIESVPTVREADGLAMSSRNRRLTKTQRRLAAKLYPCLLDSESDDAAHAALGLAGFSVDYVTSAKGRRFGAVRVGAAPDEIRLIDNVRIKL